MALVIFCVALVAAMRTRMSFRLGIGSIYPLAPGAPRPCRAEKITGRSVLPGSVAITRSPWRIR